MPGRHARRLRISKPDRPWHSHQHTAVRPSGRRVGYRNWAEKGGLRDAFAAPDQGLDHLQADRKSARCTDPAWPHEDREHCALPWRRHRGRLGPCRGNRDTEICTAPRVLSRRAVSEASPFPDSAHGGRSKSHRRFRIAAAIAAPFRPPVGLGSGYPVANRRRMGRPNGKC